MISLTCLRVRLCLRLCWRGGDFSLDEAKIRAKEQFYNTALKHTQDYIQEHPQDTPAEPADFILRAAKILSNLLYALSPSTELKRIFTCLQHVKGWPLAALKQLFQVADKAEWLEHTIGEPLQISTRGASPVAVSGASTISKRRKTTACKNDRAAGSANPISKKGETVAKPHSVRQL